MDHHVETHPKSSAPGPIDGMPNNEALVQEGCPAGTSARDPHPRLFAAVLVRKLEDI